MFFTKAYMTNNQIVIVPAESSIRKISDLAGKRIGLQKGSTALDAIRNSAMMNGLSPSPVIKEFRDN
jgi:polar amino acid transport system substrate-binding protein